MSEAPDTIYLYRYPRPAGQFVDTWCDERNNANDAEYVRKDKADALAEALENIVKHQLAVAGPMSNYSAIAAIADRPLAVYRGKA